MLIFVQVYRTIDKSLYLYKVLEEQKRAKESTKKKLEASEEKCSWSTKCSWSDDIIRNKFIRSASSEARSPEAEVHQKMKNLKDSKSWKYDLITSNHCKRLKEYNNGPWKGISKHWMLVLSRALTKDNCTNCTTTTSTTMFVSLQQDKDNSSACRNVPSYKECIWNWSFIGQ